MSSTKTVLANQARFINQYRNLRSKVFKCCVNIYFNIKYLRIPYGIEFNMHYM